jgi:hypothetical protein
MNRSSQNIIMIEEVAKALGNLLPQCVFTGGATTALYIDDPGAPEPTPSDDVDLVLEVATHKEYVTLEQDLRKHGFKDPAGFDDAPICRKYLGAIAVDFMTPDPKILGFSNEWYPEALQHSIPFSLPSGRVIRIFALPYFVASKLAAFQGRGATQDIRMSQDLEDICSVLDGNAPSVSEILNSNPRVRTYIASEFSGLLLDRDILEEAAHGFIGYTPEGRPRVARLMTIISEIASA